MINVIDDHVMVLMIIVWTTMFLSVIVTCMLCYRYCMTREEDIIDVDVAENHNPVEPNIPLASLQEMVQNHTYLRNEETFVRGTQNLYYYCVVDYHRSSLFGIILFHVSSVLNCFKRAVLFSRCSSQDSFLGTLFRSVPLTHRSSTAHVAKSSLDFGGSLISLPRSIPYG